MLLVVEKVKNQIGPVPTANAAIHAAAHATSAAVQAAMTPGSAKPAVKHTKWILVLKKIQTG